MTTRFFVSLWHGENGSIAEVRDRENPDECLGIYSTIRYGARFREVAEKRAAECNGLKPCPHCGSTSRGHWHSFPPRNVSTGVL